MILLLTELMRFSFFFTQVSLLLFALGAARKSGTCIKRNLSAKTGIKVLGVETTK